jgi:hypothetical protein
MNTINLPSSNDQNILVDKIRLANQSKAVLNLLPGPHLTKPGYNQKIPIDKNGLHITGSLGTGGCSSIQRPDHAIDLNRSDNNYGLFFIPSEPTPEDWASIRVWQTYTDTDTHKTFEYAIIIRGVITIENLELDCNMGNQGLPVSMSANLIEHSCMLGFAGQRYANPQYPNKFIFVGFESVTLNNIRANRGGYADDILIGRGYFRPNIGKVSINTITSQNRINEKRSTITFSGLTQNVEVTNADIFRLEAEETSVHWKNLPGEPINPSNQYSYWKLNSIVCDILDLAAKGQAIFLDAHKIESRKSTNLYQLGGLMQNCTFNLLPQFIRLNRLNALVFKEVTWIFLADVNGKVLGLAPRAQSGELCSATFQQNTFKVKGNFTKGQLIETEHSAQTPTESNNAVNLEFINCNYDERFGSVNLPDAHIAQIREKGTWKFTLSDFRGVPWERMLLIPHDVRPSTNAGNLVITIT